MKISSIALFITCLVFSFWLMSKTLSSSQGVINVSGKYWSDFGAQLPLIRYFSLGNNIPTEHPLFPTEKIRYHFLFYQLVGAWEKSGLPISYSLNIPSSIGLFSMWILVWVLSFKLFRSYYISFLSVLFNIFNSSFSWIDYLKQKNFSIVDSASGLLNLNSFPSFAPWNDSIISAFWNLNIYTNQRHLAFSFSLVLLVIIFCVRKSTKALYFSGVIFSILLLTNQPSALILGVFLISFFIFIPQIRKALIISSLGLIPGLVLYMYIFPSPSPLNLHFGFLQNQPITLSSFFIYWLNNLGFHIVLIPIGLIISLKKSFKMMIPIILLFIVPNLVQFSPDIINNHKFFNFFLVVGSMFSAYIIKKIKLFGIVLIPLLILGGLIDIFPIINDQKYELVDYKINPDSRYIQNNIPKESNILNSTWFYHPASLTGRKIYNGYSYFTWSYGYNQVERESSTKSIYASTNKQSACSQLRSAHIDYVEISDNPESFLDINRQLWDNEFVYEYINPSTNLKLINVKANCNL